MNENWDEDDYPEEDWDAYTSEEDDWISCPACGSEIYHDADQCPQCGEYVTGTTSGSQKPFWVIIVAVILVILFLIQGFSF